MRLTSDDGTLVELRPLRYQFESVTTPGDWDANWLVVAVRVRLPDARSWSASDACLTTWEARELGPWLRQVRSGEVAPTPFDGGEDEVALDFTEPELALSLAARDTTSVTLRVHLSLAFLPPWLQGPARPDLHAYAVEVTVPADALTDAEAEWARELAVLPVR